MSGSMTPPRPVSADATVPGTDDELSGLLGSIRRYILDVPEEVWDPPVREAAKQVCAALSDRLAPSRHH